MRRSLAAMLAMACLACATAADDPYAPWMQGRPQDAIAGLLASARASGAWSAWYDCALAAQATGDPGKAHAWLLEAHRQAPARPEPLAALRADGGAVPPTWIERLGPIAAPGCGWTGVALLAGAGALLGWWCCSRRRRGGVIASGLVLLAAAAPGAIASWIDAREPLLAVVRDTHLVDSTGATTVAVASGTVVVGERQPPWNGRVLVRTPEGARGYLSLAETRVEP
jgi:hypothetical protein